MSIHNLQYFKDDFWNKQREEFLSKEDAVNGILLGQDWNLVGNTTANNPISLPDINTFDEIYVEMFHSEGTIMHQEEFKKESLLFESTNITHREILLDSIGDTHTYVTYDIENNTIIASSIEGNVVDENSTNVFMGVYIKKTESSDASIPSKRVIYDDTTSQLGVNNIKDAIDKIVENVGNINNELDNLSSDASEITYNDSTVADALNELNNELDNVVSTANSYTDTKVADLVGSAPETLNTLEEVAQAISENEDVVTALNNAIGSKANQSDLETLQSVVNTKANQSDLTNLTTNVNTNTSNISTNTTNISNLNTEVASLKKSVADGKSLLATTISGYGYTTVASDASFETINTGIETTITGCYVPNGRQWTRSNYAQYTFYYVHYAKGMWVAGNNRGIHYSTDGMIWTQSNITSGNFYTIYYANGIWVAGGSKGLYYSTDGINWTQSNITGEAVKIVVRNENGVWVTGKYYSTDGKTWIQSNTGTFKSIYYANGLYVAGSSSEGLYYSTDGKTWAQSNITSAYINCVYYADGVWTTGGYYSTDGKTWTKGNTSISFYSIYYANGIYVACNSSGVYYSTDGINWIQGNITKSTNYGFQIVYNANGMWVLGSESNGDGIYYSTDGINWTQSNITSGYFNNFYNANGLWVVSGSNGLYYSKSA